ncbi:MAG: hypothetical protein UR39_C0002G0013 [Candidatus Woesebacteria bacterium GW2011_GWA1_33_30]|uniref:7 transmembrane helices usually fused to an inactive transglutaminase domain-containing protein n=1 Tax=Candidatus Woesebacteria bacterium GW2011_GWA2_33_28 TaxID=1618561 RepID=A0A0G0C9S5_9BACT|nr:MAG: hypothetical protein UR38_C0002G0013 [Candidatus Woesebacteria bacterium GW2011_GWA2_33_28]KKP48723.1 MAG: hypothetical protein UR39_C0002G0013 [Candidatus Woesebacteria bacterium GW2011_GWA1_33_30]KKP49996.1 MAG: hypothetical protein UR40_C0002G0013 [Microgenomates group bacterium GW2011_GWC1_33_32]KKP51767.1 MAG: hypothetical protein UR44_C0006G0013 [Candidatus Woesebacteria bacterium GW2011_GWB1_33_38]KKP56772.1 MAG: hypothetical protein UR48_C0029G0003 [Microgenomates group bacteriu
MKKVILVFLLFLTFQFISYGLRVTSTMAKTTPSPVATILPSPIPTEISRVDITQKSEEAVGPLEKLIKEQTLSSIWPFNPLKYAIKDAVNSGIPANTIVLLLLLPVVATVIAATRQLIGIRGFGIFLPAALSVTFVAIGPALGIILFLIIGAISMLVRLLTRKLKLRLQYLPKMALILWFVSFGILGVLFISPYANIEGLKNVSIFPVLVLTLLVEDFTKIQLGKSVKTAIGITSQTLLLALLSYLFLTFAPFQKYVLLNPEISLFITFAIDIILGRYIGLRFMEYKRFRKLISGK